MSVQGSTKGTRATNAFARAVNLWREAAVHVRGELRRQGVQGPIRRLDEQAAGTRGVAAPRQLFLDAREMAQRGLPEAIAIAHVTRVAESTVRLAYTDTRRPA